MTTQKQPKKKKYLMRHFIKEMKRVKWPTNKQNWVAFTQTIIFAIVVTLFIFAFTTLVTFILKGIGIQTS